MIAGGAAARCRRRCASGGGATGSIAACSRARWPIISSFIPTTRCRAGWKMPTRCCAAASAFTAMQSMCRDGVSVFDLPPPIAGLGRRRCTALPGCRRCPAPAARCGAHAGDQSDHANGSSAMRAIPNRPGRRTSWRGGWSHIFSHGRLVIAQFRHDVALAGCSCRCANSRGCWSASAAKRPTACRGWKPPRRWRCRAPAWTTARAGCEAGLARLEEEIERQILPDGGHVSRSPEALLHAYRHLIMVMDALTRGGSRSRRTRCATRMTAWRRCCASSAMAMARWRCSMAGGKAIRA